MSKFEKYLNESDNSPKFDVNKVTFTNGLKFSHLDNYGVVNTQTHKLVQTDYSEGRASKAKDIFNNHEKTNDRPEVYTVVRLNMLPASLFKNKGY